MPQLELQQSRRGHRSSAELPESPRTPVLSSLPDPGVLAPSPEMVFVDTIRNELDSYFVGLKQLNSKPPEEVFAFLSAISARLSEIRAICWRSEARRLTGLRTHEIDPLIEEVDRQFRVHSRIQACLQFEWEMTKAAPA